MPKPPHSKPHTTPASGGRTKKRNGRGGVPDILYHATTKARITKYLETGRVELNDGRPVFLSLHEGQAWQVAHRHKGEPDVLYIDVSRAKRNGCRFTRNHLGLWQAKGIPTRHVLNLQPGFAHQVSAGGIPTWFGPDGPELALIQVRRRFGTTWEVAKGKMEPGEHPLQTAAREIQEEMGTDMSLTLERSLGFVRYGFMTPDNGPRLKTLHMYLFRTPERVTDFHPANAEQIEDVQWFSPEAAVDVTVHRSLLPLVRRVANYLAGGGR